MPLNDLHLHYANIIDSSIDHLLADFHELPTEDAIHALQILSKQKKLKPDAREYEALPEALLGKSFEKISETLNHLSRIMQNCHPENETKHHNDQASDTFFGIFGLSKLPIPSVQPITADQVHNYLIHKFQIKIWTLKCLNTVIIPHLSAWKKNCKPLYLSLLSQWIKNKDTMPESMKKMLESNGILLDKIQSYIKKNDPTMIEQDQVNLARAIISDVSELSATLVDHDANIIESVFLILPMEELGTQFELQRRALEAIQQYTQNQNFTEIIPACESFVSVERVYQILCRVGKLLEYDSVINNFNDIKKICADYLKQFLDTPPKKTQGLTQETLNGLNDIYKRAEAYQEAINYDFFTHFFAQYFKSELNDRRKCLSLLPKTTLHLNDAWLKKISSIEEKQENSPQITLEVGPYHINRILLHGCFTPPAQWTPLFALVFHKAVNMIQNSSIPMNAILHRNSYPPNFIHQLAWLTDISGTKTQPKTVFPLIFFPMSKYEIAIFSNISLDKFKQVILHSREKLSHFIRTEEDFRDAFSQFTGDLFYTACSNFLPKIITQPFDFKSLIAYYRSDQRAIVAYSLEEKWPELIKTVSDFCQINELLPDDITATIFDSLLNQWPGIVKSEDEFVRLFNSQRLTQKKVLLNIFKNKWAEILETTQVFCEIYSILDEQHRITLINAFDNKWSELIETVGQFIKIHAILKDHNKNTNQLFNNLNGKWGLVIRNANDFCKLIPYLNMKQFSIIREELKNKWIDIIKSTSDFDKIIKILSDKFNNILPEMRAVIFRAIQKKLPELISNIENWNEIIPHLTLSQCLETLSIIKNQFAEFLIPFSDPFVHLNPKYIPAIINHLIILSPDIINTPDDLFNLLNIFNDIDIKKAFKNLEKKLPTIINTSNEYILIKDYFSGTHQNKFFTIMHDKWHEIIDTPNDLNALFLNLTHDQCADLCIILKDHLPKIVLTTNDFIKLFENFSPDKTIAVLNSLKDQLPTLLFQMNLSEIYDYFRYKNHNSDACAILWEKLDDISQKTLEYIRPKTLLIETVTPVIATHSPSFLPSPSPTNSEAVKTDDDFIEPEPIKQSCTERAYLHLHSLFSQTTTDIKIELDKRLSHVENFSLKFKRPF